MKNCIGSIDIWDNHGCRVICKGLDIIEYYYHVEEILRCVVWQHEDEISQDNIGCRIFQVEYDRNYGAHDLPGAHGTARGWGDLIVMGADIGELDTAEIWNNIVRRR